VIEQFLGKKFEAEMKDGLWEVWVV